MAYFYKEANYGGPFLYMQGGTVYGRNIIACPNKSYSCEEVAGEIKSIRVESNTIVMISESTAMYSMGAKVLIGPVDVPNNSFNIQSILVKRYRAYDLAAHSPMPLMTLYSSMGLTGLTGNLNSGKYDKARLMSEEVKFNPENILSFKLNSGAMAVIESDQKTILVVGPKSVGDLNDVGLFSAKILTINIIFDDTDFVENKIKNLINTNIQATSKTPKINNVKITEKIYIHDPPDTTMNKMVTLFLFLIIFMIINILRFRIIHVNNKASSLGVSGSGVNNYNNRV